MEKLAQGLSAQRIFQDLSNDHDYVHGYDSVKRFVRQFKVFEGIAVSAVGV